MPAATRGMIAIQGLTFRYPGAERPALDGIDLVIHEGEFLVVAGPSGCGKSTLALAIGGYLHQRYESQVEGTLRIAGRSATEHTVYEWADVVGLVQQNPEDQFCTLTVEDEVAFGLENRCLPVDEIHRRLYWSLDVVGAEALRGRALATLSGGEKQKVAIAAMLAAHPRVLIFDEPTSNLDPTATAAVFGVLDRVRREVGITLIVIEHKLEQMRPFSPRLVRMAKGRIVEHDGRILALPPPVERIPAASKECLVNMRNLSLDYGSTRALRDISLDLHAGQVVALMGDNGSGKTTFLCCLMGLLPPSAGSVAYPGLGMETRAVSALARHLGFIFQNPDHQLFANTVWDEATMLGRNLDLGEAVGERAIALLCNMGLAAQRSHHPFALSYGEKRRLNVVSAVAHAPRLLLADEVLIGQDGANASALMARLRQLADTGAGVVLSLHDPRAALEIADRVLFFRGGEVVIDAAPREALAQLAAWGAYDAYRVLS